MSRYLIFEIVKLSLSVRQHVLSMMKDRLTKAHEVINREPPAMLHSKYD